MRRLAAGTPVHPISAYLAALPRAGAADFIPLLAAVNAAAAEAGGAPLEHGADLELHAQALWGDPLALASRLAGEVADEAGLRRCTRALAAARYLAKALHGYRREARAGRVPFAVDELLAAGVGNDDLAADPPPRASAGLSGCPARPCRRLLRGGGAGAAARRARPQSAPLDSGGARADSSARRCAAARVAPITGYAARLADGAARPSMNSELA